MSTLGKLFGAFSKKPKQPEPLSLEELKTKTRQATKTMEITSKANNLLAHLVSSALTTDQFKKDNLVPSSLPDISVKGFEELKKNLPSYDDLPQEVKEQAAKTLWPNFVSINLLQENIIEPFKELEKRDDLSDEDIEIAKQYYLDTAIKYFKKINTVWYQQTLDYFNESRKTMPVSLLTDIINTAQETGLIKEKEFPQWFTRSKVEIPEDRYSAHLKAANKPAQPKTPATAPTPSQP